MTGKDRILNEILEVFKKHNYTGFLLAATGVGKGRAMIEMAKILKPKSILYLCNSEELRDKMFEHECRKFNAEHLLAIVDKICYQTAYKWKDREYDLLLADEADFAIGNKYQDAITNNKFKYKILVSATLDEDKRTIAKSIAPIIFEKKQSELIEDNVLNKIQFYFINYDLNEKENTKYLAYNKRFKELLNSPQSRYTSSKLGKLQIERKQFLSSLESSKNATKWLLNSLSKKQEKILIFCGLSKQADEVCINSYHSINNNIQGLRDFEIGKIKTLSIVEKITRGVNIDGVKHIILESVGRSKTKITQKIGRGLRLDVNDTLNVFFLIPYFKHPFFGKKVTIVEDWIKQSTKDMNLNNVKIMNYE